MKPNIKEVFEKITNTRGLVIIFIVGIALLLMPSSCSRQANETKIETEAFSNFKYTDYEKKLESRLSHILSTVQGISDVSVMITLEDSGEMHYAQNNTSETKNANDGVLSENIHQSSSSLALKNETGNSQSPIFLKTGLPRISGVLVTAKGVNSPSLQADIKSAVRAVLNVSLHRVHVLPKA